MNECKVDVEKLERKMGIKITSFDEKNVYYEDNKNRVCAQMTIQEACKELEEIDSLEKEINRMSEEEMHE